MSKRTRILVTIFGGWFGLHKFMDKKIGMGILYFLTAGLFGIGWIIDIIKECIAKPRIQSWSNVYGPNGTVIGNGIFEVESHVAGTSYYNKAISKSMKSNSYYKLPDDKLIKLGKERVYEYFPLHENVTLVPEPTNPHDKNAVMVMLNHSLIGYIPGEDAPFVCKLIASNSLLSAEVDILGGNVKTIYPNGDVVIGKNNFHINLKYTYKK